MAKPEAPGQSHLAPKRGSPTLIIHDIKEFLGTRPVQALFLPFAAVTTSWEDYESSVKSRFNEVGHDVIAGYSALSNQRSSH